MSTDVELGELLKAHQPELKAIADAASSGNREKVIDATASLALSLATGNPLLGALAPMGRKAIAHIFGGSVNDALTRELAALATQQERTAFLGQISEVVEALLGQALIQIVRSQHAVKDEILESLGGLQRGFASFRSEFAAQLAGAPESVRVDALVEVTDGGIGVRVAPGTTKRVVLRQLAVRGPGSIGIDLT